jgi:tetratricopeptide (TPR) repeat protein
MTEDASQTDRTGLGAAVGAYVIWGFLPLYLILVRSVPPFEFVGWRIIWTLPLCLLIVAYRKQGGEVRRALAERKTLALLLLSATLIAINWVVYVWAIQNGQVYAASLGYYINPLVNVLLGTLLSTPLSAGDDEQTRIAREMIQVLDAYAVYKMGDFDEAFERYRQLAEAGNRQGMLNLGNMYAAGLGSAADLEQALAWYQRAADAGDAIGMYEVARAHDLGLGTEADPDQAVQWYRRAAEQDNAEAQWTLGERLYKQGQQIVPMAFTSAMHAHS